MVLCQHTAASASTQHDFFLAVLRMTRIQLLPGSACVSDSKDGDIVALRCGADKRRQVSREPCDHCFRCCSVDIGAQCFLDSGNVEHLAGDVESFINAV